MGEINKENSKEMKLESEDIEQIKERVISKNNRNQPVCLIVLGMAGSGKTSFVRQLSIQSEKTHPSYIVNLDPACKDTPYPAKIDIRDTVNYKEVMKQYRLGPNGAIVTSLNLFATKFDDVIKLIENSNPDYKHCVFDTPGQIEVFTWSVSGTIITESLASTFPTVVVYVMDTVRSVSPVTFMSNMLYACSILYKTKLPFIIVMNKTDVIDNSYAVEWMNDFETFHEALEANESGGYMNKLTHSMSMVLDEFYAGLRVCGVSSMTGEGFGKFNELVKEATEEYEKDYRIEWEKIRAQSFAKKEQETREKLERMAMDTKDAAGVSNVDKLLSEGWMGTELSEVYLKHPANESSEDEEGEEEVWAMDDDDRTEAESFKNFLENQVKKQKSKVGVQDGPSTSKVN